MSLGVRRAITRVLRGPRPDGELLLVVDEAGWILDDVARQIANNLPVGQTCRIGGRDWARATNCTLHFINRAWAWADGALDAVDTSNRLIGVWWHGRLDSPEPLMQAALRRLRSLHHRFARIQVTCSSARETLDAIGVPAGKIVMLPLGIDLVTFRPPANDDGRREWRDANGVAPDAVVIGCFQKDGSGWDEGCEPKLIKGPDVLIDALASLHAKRPVHALVPGPARGYVTRGLRAAGVPFSAPGMVPRDALPRLYHALDLYVSPSRDEGGPAGVLEAMASGVPVVSTRAGIPADLIDSGANGLLVNVDDPEALASAVAELIDRPDFRSRIAAGGLASIQPYGWPLVAARYADELYRA